MTVKSKIIEINDKVKVANHLPFVLFSGVNVLESRDLAMTVAEEHVKVCQALDIPYVFKGSFDKANRSSINSFRGPGMEEGLRILEEVKNQFDAKFQVFLSALSVVLAIKAHYNLLNRILLSTKI